MIHCLPQPGTALRSLPSVALSSVTGKYEQYITLTGVHFIVHSMKKIVFGIALILFGFSMAYISIQAEWGIMQVVSVLSVFIGLFFSIFGFIERKK